MVRRREEERLKDRGRNTRRQAAPPSAVAWLVVDHGDDPEESRAELVFANTERQARALAAPHICERYTDGLYPPPDTLEVRRAPRADHLGCATGIVMSLEAQRLAGLVWFGNPTCGCCGLGQPDGSEKQMKDEWFVCDDCDQCGECGHDDDCAFAPEEAEANRG